MSDQPAPPPANAPVSAAAPADRSTGSRSREVADAPGKPGPERVAPAIGLVLVVVAILSLLDDTGIVESSPWLPFVAGAIAAALALAARTTARLLRPQP